jgi:hypothetical protein
VRGSPVSFQRRSAGNKGAAGRTTNIQPLLILTFTLEIEFQAELKLSRIEGSGRAAEIFSSAVALAEGINVCEERRCRAFVEPIEKIEAFGNHVQPHAFRKAHGAWERRSSEEFVRDAAIASESRFERALAAEACRLRRRSGDPFDSIDRC